MQVVCKTFELKIFIQRVLTCFCLIHSRYVSSWSEIPSSMCMLKTDELYMNQTGQSAVL